MRRESWANSGVAVKAGPQTRRSAIGGTSPPTHPMAVRRRVRELGRGAAGAIQRGALLLLRLDELLAGALGAAGGTSPLARPVDLALRGPLEPVPRPLLLLAGPQPA